MNISAVIPGRSRSERTRNPDADTIPAFLDSGFAPSARPGMTAASYVRLANSTNRLVMALFGSVMGSQMVK
jgi:hypothetical protein